ncbi:breast cancer anti-estrogen resistance protein 3 homolog isoform X2 [Teleopsis dalmanni]|nr:breast cancer anti-estrogen resistance protein 3 homolog isoform X2 [Teleopsis dalmanni]
MDSNTGSTTEPTSLTTTNEQQEAIALKKALEWELSLDSRDLKSHAWYHGPLPRQRAEEIVQSEGDFLIRDCASQPDNYVLTCRTKTSVLHFVINKILLQPETVYERVQFQFEEDAFDAVPDLITFYVGSGKPISAASGARIQFPCNRTYPLSFYGHKIVGNQLHTQMLAGIRGTSPLNSPLSNNSSFRFGTTAVQQMQQQQGQQHQQTNSPMSSPPRVKRDIPPRLPSKKQRSQSLTPAQAMVVSNMKHCDSGDESNNGDAIINGNSVSFKGVRRFSNFEKCNSLGGSPSEQQLQTAHLEHIMSHNKIHSNGFQTIARCSASEIVDHVKFTTHSLPRPATNSFRTNTTRISGLARDFSTESSSSLNTSLDGKQIPELPEKAPSPPPKPNRVPPTLPRKEKDIITLEQQQNSLHRAAAAAAAAAVYQASGSDSGNGSGDSVQSSIPGDMSEFTLHRGVIIKNPRFMSNSASSATLKSLTEFDAAAAEDQLFTLEIPKFKPVSKFDIENFSTLLLPSVDNKPLDGDALSTFKMMLLETGPKMIAEHITRIDISLLLEELPEEDENYEHNVLDCCGLEMLTLPQGKVFRHDLIERTQCIKLMVAVTILTCQTDLDRAEILSKWIQIAVETKTALGNLFGFCAIMLGLCMQQIQKLDQAWHILRQKYTDSAFTFEAKLRPTLISMNECSNPQAPNTTVPHVLLYALLKDRQVIDILNINSTIERSSLYMTCITSWENKADDFGMSINFLHLDSARNFLANLTLFRKNAKIVLEESNSRLDELLSDAFRTEFHVKFLWGSKGALAASEDRHSKLEKVLSLMADKFCNVDGNTAAA